ncbi:hypothetical protein TrST_g5972 [Triparma strigata]|uniref:N-acetyltransferase domain-containing protein n=1 Tax=Triparma strigata TaxID=1606541 RepID=A0A9W7BH45_9STRA|nr:hypothetical protein TrST_g5972 [Triparma strigata]
MPPSNNNERIVTKIDTSVITSASLPRMANGKNYTSSYKRDTKSTDYRRGLEKIYGPEVGRGAPRLLPPPSTSSSKSSSRKTTVSYNLSYVPQFLNTSFKHLLGLAHWPYSIPTSRKSKPTKQMRDEGRVESIIWCPGSREEWDDCVEEMTTLAAQASYRRAIKQSSSSGTISPPLSLQYIRERTDIDDPLKGYQVRHDGSGYLQGFVLMTTFTCWVGWFKWTSSHPQSGMAGRRGDGFDEGNVIASQLEECKRGGDPNGQGVVWPRIAEISLAGGLGCGEFLVSMALEDLVENTKYDFVVLQATPSSLSFYERFGFVRVGAVCRYATNPNSVVGYRHWTYKDEKHLSKHGGPSYMMAIDLKILRRKNRVGLKKLCKDYFVEEKPTIQRKLMEEWNYSENDLSIQNHPGFFAPVIKVKEKKRVKPPAAHSSKKRKSIKEWTAVKPEDYGKKPTQRRVNKYTAMKREMSEDDDLVGDAEV